MTEIKKDYILQTIRRWMLIQQSNKGWIGKPEEVETESGKKQGYVGRREGVAPKLTAEMNEQSSKAVIYFKYFESCFSMEEGPQNDVEVRVNDGLTVFGAISHFHSFSTLT